MLRTMLLNRPGLLLLILLAPAPRAAAGPIFTHPFESPGNASWIHGNAGGSSLPSSTGPIGQATWVSSWVDVQSGPSVGLLAPARGGNPSWPVQAAAAGNAPDRALPGAAVSSANHTLPAGPTAAAGSAGSPAGSPAAADQPGSRSVPEGATRRGTDAPGRAVDVANASGSAAVSSGHGAPGPSPPASPGGLLGSGAGTATPSSYQASPAGLADPRASGLTGGTLSPASASQGQAVSATGGAVIPGAASANPMPNSSSGAGAVVPQAAAVPTSQLNPGGPAPATSTVAAATTSPTASAAPLTQVAGATSPSSATSAAMLAAAASALPVAGSSSPSPTAPATTSAAGTGPQGQSAAASAIADAINSGGATPSGVTPSQAPSGGASSSGTLAQIGQANPTVLVPITPSPLSAATVSGPAVISSQQLSSAIGGSPSLAASLGVASVPVAPAPLSASTTLPPTQVGPLISTDPSTGTFGSVSDSGVLPQSLPEPGPLALLAVVLLTSLMKAKIRRRSGTEAPGRGRQSELFGASLDPR